MKMRFLYPVLAFSLTACGQLNETAPTSLESRIKKSYRYTMCGYISRPGGGTGGSFDMKIQTGSGTYTLDSTDEYLRSMINLINFSIGCAYGDEIKQGFEGPILMVKKLQLQEMT